MKKIIAAVSVNREKEKSFDEVVSTIKENNSSPLGIMFFSATNDFQFYTEKFHEIFPQTKIIGSTTYISFSNNIESSSGLYAVSFNCDIEISGGVIHNISTFPMKSVRDVENAIKKLSSTENTCCLEFCSAFSNGEELVLDTFKKAFEGTDIILAGGSAGASKGFFTTRVSMDGEVFNNSCVFMLVHNLTGKIAVAKENPFMLSGTSFLVTDVDVERRVVYELNNEPAADLIAKTLNLSIEELSRELNFHPLGHAYEEGYFISGISRIDPDGSIVCFSRVYNNTRVQLMQYCNSDNPLKKLCSKIKSEIEKPAFALIISDIANANVFEDKTLSDNYAEMLNEYFPKFISVTGYGEQLRGIHYNQNVLVIAFE